MSGVFLYSVNFNFFFFVSIKLKKDPKKFILSPEYRHKTLILGTQIL